MWSETMRDEKTHEIWPNDFLLTVQAQYKDTRKSTKQYFVDLLSDNNISIYLFI